MLRVRKPERDGCFVGAGEGCLKTEKKNKTITNPPPRTAVQSGYRSITRVTIQSTI
jgi:hypothetical protein